MKKTFLYLIFPVAILAFSGCLKTANVYEGFSSIKPIADIPLSHLSNVNDSTTLFTLDIAPNPSETIDTAIAVHLSDKDHVGDVTFKMAVVESDPTFLAMYNNNQAIYDIYNNEDLTGRSDSATIAKYVAAHPNWTIMPDSLYTITNLNVTIPNAGVLNIGRMGIKFKTGAVDQNGVNMFATHSYILPIAIQDASGYEIASNFREIFLVVGAKNEWDGKYKIHVSISGPNSYAGTVFDDNVSLSTSGLISASESDIADFFGGYTNYSFNSDGTIGIFAGTAAGSGSYGAVVNASSYDKSTHSFHVNFSILSGKYIFDLTYEKQ